MKNKKAASNIGPIGIVLIGFIGIMVGLALLTSIASNASSVDDTITRINTTYTAPAVGAYSDIDGCQELIGSYTITNATGGETVPTTNITMVERVGTDGYKTVSINTVAGFYASRSINASYVCGPDGYVEDSGARSIISLVVLFTCLAIAAVGLIVAIKNGYIDINSI